MVGSPGLCAVMGRPLSGRGRAGQGSEAEQGPEDHAEADHADEEDQRADHRDAKRIDGEVGEARAEPDPGTERGRVAGAACQHHADQRDDGDGKGFLKIGLGAGKASGEGMERRELFVARAHVPAGTILLGLEMHGRENVDEQQDHGPCENCEFDGHITSS